jgi:hypothetical protein
MTIIDAYRDAGYASFSPVTIDTRDLGERAAFTTVRWHALDADGNVARDTLTTYQMHATPASCVFCRRPTLFSPRHRTARSRGAAAYACLRASPRRCMRRSLRTKGARLRAHRTRGCSRLESASVAAAFTAPPGWNRDAMDFWRVFGDARAELRCCRADFDHDASVYGNRRSQVRILSGALRRHATERAKRGSPQGLSSWPPSGCRQLAPGRATKTVTDG